VKRYIIISKIGVLKKSRLRFGGLAECEELVGVTGRLSDSVKN
jgi:hypothetical protein